MAVRAILSPHPPGPSEKFDDFWVGAFEADGDDGAGLTVAGIVTFLADAEPARWYRLSELRDLIDKSDWHTDDDQWTILQIKMNTISGAQKVSIRVKIKPAVEDLCNSISQFLHSFDEDNIWIRFE